MKIELDRLNDLANSAHRANSLALQAMDALRVEQPGAASYNLAILQGKLRHIEQQLILLGADDPREAWMRSLQERRAAEGLPPIHDECDTPLHLLSSDKAQRNALTMRAAAIALRDMENERGIVDGMAERIEDLADIYGMECFGPKGLGESASPC